LTYPSQWLHDRFSHVDGAVVAEIDGGHRCAIRQRPQDTGRSKFIWSRLGNLMEDVENLSCLSKRIDQPACQHGSNRVQTEFEGGGDPEVGTGASQSPEEVWVLVGTDRMIAARAIFDGPEKVVHVRVARHGDDTVYLDLCNDPWEAVEITASGWHIVLSQAVPVKFVRKDNTAPLPYPTRSGTVEILRRFLNVETDEDFALRTPQTANSMMVEHELRKSLSTTLGPTLR
jgi:hypothetical protein